MTEDEVVEWHHRLDGHEFEQALGVGNDSFPHVLSSCVSVPGSLLKDSFFSLHL